MASFWDGEGLLSFQNDALEPGPESDPHVLMEGASVAPQKREPWRGWVSTSELGKWGGLGKQGAVQKYGGWAALSI